MATGRACACDAAVAVAVAYAAAGLAGVDAGDIADGWRHLAWRIVHATGLEDSHTGAEASRSSSVTVD